LSCERPHTKPLKHQAMHHSSLPATANTHPPPVPPSSLPYSPPPPPPPSPPPSHKQKKIIHDSHSAPHTVTSIDWKGSRGEEGHIFIREPERSSLDPCLTNHF